jgi:cyclohexanone monooxygenase
MLEMIQRPPLKSASREEQLRAIEENGVIGALSWGDVFFDIQANQMAARLYGEAVARIVNDADTAAALTPSHPFGCKRPIIDQGYYAEVPPVLLTVWGVELGFCGSSGVGY